MAEDRQQQQQQQQQQQLFALALKAAKNAFCTFSKQRLGVSIKGSDGRMRAGCTYDSAAFPCSICAAHVAVAQTATEGRALSFSVVLPVMSSFILWRLKQNMNTKGIKRLSPFVNERDSPFGTMSRHRCATNLFAVYGQVAECAVVEILEESEENEFIFPLKGCCLEWLCEYAHPDEVYVHCAVTNTQAGIGQLEKARTFKLSELIPQGRRLPRPFLLEGLSLSVVKAETEEEQNAIGYAAALGHKRILKAAVVCTTMPQAACHPCGRCLQLLLQAQERTRAAAPAAPAAAFGAAEVQPQQLVLLMPWQQGEDNADRQNSWMVKTRLLNQMGPEDRFML
ncbi:hypothetical protein Emag_000141 [Eimeria magna]